MERINPKQSRPMPTGSQMEYLLFKYDSKAIQMLYEVWRNEMRFLKVARERREKMLSDSGAVIDGEKQMITVIVQIGDVLSAAELNELRFMKRVGENEVNVAFAKQRASWRSVDEWQQAIVKKPWKTGSSNAVEQLGLALFEV